MAANTVVSNLALGHLGQGKLVGNVVTETSNEAQVCRLFWDVALEEVLRDCDWSFVRKYSVLNLISEDPNPNWRYMYEYPSDALFIRKILINARKETMNSAIPFEVAEDVSGRVIFCDMNPAPVQYTTLGEDVSAWPSDFKIAFAYKLAFYIAPRICIGQPEIQQAMLGLYQRSISTAKKNNGNEQQFGKPVESEFVNARNGSPFNTCIKRE